MKMVLPFIKKDYPTQYEWVRFPDKTTQIVCKAGLRDLLGLSPETPIACVFLSKTPFKGSKKVLVKKYDRLSNSTYTFTRKELLFYRGFYDSSWWASFASPEFYLYLGIGETL